MPVAIHAVTDDSSDADDCIRVAEADAGVDGAERARANAERDRCNTPVALSLPRRNRSAVAGAGDGTGTRADAMSRRGSRQSRRSGTRDTRRDASEREGEGEMTRVKSVINMWEIEDEWWREVPIRRRYWRLRLETGQEVTVFEDLETARWFQQDY